MNEYPTPIQFSVDEPIDLGDDIFAYAITDREGVFRGIMRPADVLKRGSGSLLGNYVFFGHPSQEGIPQWPDMAAGQIVAVRHIGAEGPEDTARNEVVIQFYRSRLTPEFLEKLAAGDPIDCSVGFWSVIDEEPGVWREMEYVGSERALCYQHLAIVPMGECSWSGGCGIYKMQKVGDIVEHEEEKKIKEHAEEGKPTEPEPESKTFLAPVRGEDGIEWVSVDTEEEMKMHVMTIIDELTVELETVKESTGALEERAKAAEKCRDVAVEMAKGQYIDTISERWGVPTDKLAVYKDMTIEALKAIVEHSASTEPHHSRLPPRDPGGPPDKKGLEDLNAEYEARLGRKSN